MYRLHERSVAGFPDTLLSQRSCRLILRLRRESRLAKELCANQSDALNRLVSRANLRVSDTALLLSAVENLVDLLDFLRERIAENVLLELRESLDGLRALRLSVDGASGVAVSGRCLHGIIISEGRYEINPYDQQSLRISVSHGAAGLYVPYWLSDALWITSG